MTVKELKQLLKQVPDGLTKKEFNSLEVAIGTNDGSFIGTRSIDSGLVELELCQECQTIVENGGQANCEPEIVFGLVPCNFYTNQF